MKLKSVILLLSLTPLMAMANPKYIQQVNHFTPKQGQDWTWSALSKTPKIKWASKTPKKNTTTKEYYIHGSLGKYGNVTITGTKAKPTYISINSGQTYKESEFGENVYQLHDLFNKSELKEIRSNCTQKADDTSMGEYQHFYKWQKKGHRPLYVHEYRFVAGTFGGGIIKSYTIIKEFNDFNNSNLYEVQRPYDTNGKKRSVVCYNPSFLAK